jgi:hypothetical protein
MPSVNSICSESGLKLDARHIVTLQPAVWVICGDEFLCLPKNGMIVLNVVLANIGRTILFPRGNCCYDIQKMPLGSLLIFWRRWSGPRNALGKAAAARPLSDRYVITAQHLIMEAKKRSNTNWRT